VSLKIIGVIVTITLSILAAPLAADAQPPAKVPRIGWLSSGPPLSEERRQQLPFVQGLRDLGWIEGQNIAIEWRYAEASTERLAAFAAELVQLGVDVIVAGDSRAIPPAQQATQTIPIVMTVSGDPVGSGFVASLARPGGNITGLSNATPQLAGKRLELLTEAMPPRARVAILGPPAHPDWHALALKAQALSMPLQALEVHSPDEFEPAFAAAIRERADALLVLPAPITNYHSRYIVNLVAKSRLPAIYALREYVVAGGLMSYGPHIPALSGRAAAYVDKILKGAKPADLPVEQPMKFELVINLKTAKSLGLTIPPVLLFQADEVIQ
jgi:ABC-type uncharacterized transport system substrate-binding protein